jgi:hypothetical protein
VDASGGDWRERRVDGLWLWRWVCVAQLIGSCRLCVLAGKSASHIWEQDHKKLMVSLSSCIRVNSAYQGQYAVTKAKLLSVPKGKQFDFSETQVRVMRAPLRRACMMGSSLRRLAVCSLAADLWTLRRVLPSHREAAGHVQHDPPVQVACSPQVRVTVQ